MDLNKLNTVFNPGERQYFNRNSCVQGWTESLSLARSCYKRGRSNRGGGMVRGIEVSSLWKSRLAKALSDRPEEIPMGGDASE